MHTERTLLERSMQASKQQRIHALQLCRHRQMKRQASRTVVPTVLLLRLSKDSSFVTSFKLRELL